jgi:hypothetical protein
MDIYTYPSDDVQTDAAAKFEEMFTLNSEKVATSLS